MFSWGRGGGCFSPSDQRSSLCLLPENVGQGEERRGKWLMNTEGQEGRSYMVAKTIKNSIARTPDCTNMRPFDRCSSQPLSPQISYTSLAGPPPSALCLRSTQCCLYPMLLAVVAGSFTSLLPGSLPWFSTSSSVACHSAGSRGFKGKLDTVFMG